jgi:hypothetical protein
MMLTTQEYRDLLTEIDYRYRHDGKAHDGADFAYGVNFTLEIIYDKFLEKEKKFEKLNIFADAFGEEDE